MIWILGTLTLLLLLVTLLPISRNPAWWIRGADFPRLQFASVGIINLVLALLFLDLRANVVQALLACNGLVIVYHLYWIIPYTFIARNETKGARPDSGPDRVRIMSVNVLMTNKEADRLLRIVESEQPDVLVTLETNSWWEKALGRLEGRYPHRLQCPLENTYGMHLYSKFPLEDPKIQFLVEDGVPSMHTLLVLPSGCKVCLHCVHPPPPSPTEKETSKERDAELIMVGKSAARAKFPVIVSGDLNDVAWSPTTRLFRKVSHLLDPRVGRGMFNTFHAGYFFCRWPVDHFFHSEHFSLVRIARLPFCGSDHFPVLVELICDPSAPARQEGLRGDGDESEEASRKMKKKGVSSVEVHRPGEGGQAPRENSNLT